MAKKEEETEKEEKRRRRRERGKQNTDSGTVSTFHLPAESQAPTSNTLDIPRPSI